MNIRVKPVWIALALASTGAQAVPVHDWYAEVGGGWAIAHDLNDFSQDVSKDATALSLFGGYNFTENLGAEIGYLSTGDWDISGHDFNSKGATLSVIGRLPLSEMFSVFAEGGGYIYHVESVNGGDDNLAPLAGLGLTARLHDWVDLQARYRYIVRVGDDPDNGKANSGTQRWVSDVSTATLELVIHPNRSQPAEPAHPGAGRGPPPPAEPEVVDKTFNLSSDVLFAFGKAESQAGGDERAGRSLPADRRRATQGWQCRRDGVYRPYRLGCQQPDPLGSSRKNSRRLPDWQGAACRQGEHSGQWREQPGHRQPV